MRKIPPKEKDKMLNDNYYSICVLTGRCGDTDRIEWHHPLIYQGKQIVDAWATIPIWHRLHSPYGLPKAVHRCKETKEWVELQALRRSTPEDIKKYPKYDWEFRKEYLEKKFEIKPWRP